MLLGNPVEAVPDTLRKARGGEKEQLDAGKKSLAQVAVGFQRSDQFFPAFRHGKVGSRRDFLEIAQGFGKALSRWFTAIQVQRTAVVQNDTEVMTAAKRMVPGQPVHQHRGLFGKYRKGLQQHLLIGTEHALGGNHRFGQFGRA